MFCTVAIRAWLNLFNLVLLCGGLALAGYGGYMVHKAPSSFFDLVIASGVFMAVVALLGCTSVGGRRSCCLSLYTYLLVFLVACHATLAGFCFWSRDKVEDWVTEHANAEDAKNLEDFINENLSKLGYVTVVVLAVEVVCVLLSCFAKSKILAEREEDWDTERGSKYGDNQTQPFLKSTPKTDLQRDAMNKKYGGIFKKHQAKSDDVEIS